MIAQRLARAGALVMVEALVIAKQAPARLTLVLLQVHGIVSSKMNAQRLARSGAHRQKAQQQRHLQVDGVQTLAQYAVQRKNIIVMTKLPAQAQAETGAAQILQAIAPNKNAKLAAQRNNGTAMTKNLALEQAQAGAEIIVPIISAQLAQNHSRGIAMLKQTALRTAETGAALGAKTLLIHARQQKDMLK